MPKKKNPKKVKPLSLTEQLEYEQVLSEQKDDLIKELRETEKRYLSSLESAKQFYFQEVVFSKKYSIEILLETQKLFGIPATEILF